MRHITTILVCAALAGCGKPAPDPVGRPLPEMTTTNAVGDGGRKVDAAVVGTRRFAGAWRGLLGRDRLEITFGGDGSLTMQVENAKGIVDQASGSWREEGGKLQGSTSGASGPLARYARWSAAFAGATTMNVSGSDGAIVAVRR